MQQTRRRAATEPITAPTITPMLVDDDSSTTSNLAIGTVLSLSKKYIREKENVYDPNYTMNYKVYQSYQVAKKKLNKN